MRLFGPEALPKKCAVVTDGDLLPSDANEILDDDLQECTPQATDYANLENDYVKVFSCSTTFENALTIPGMLSTLKASTEEFGARRIATHLQAAIDAIASDAQDKAQKIEVGRDKVLNTSKRFGKARYAQVTSKHVGLATEIPNYIRNAIDWLVQ